MEVFKSILKALGWGIFYIVTFQILNLLILLPILFVSSKYYNSVESYSIDYNYYFAALSLFTVVITPLIYWRIFLKKFDFVKGEKNKKIAKTMLAIGAILLFLFNVRLLRSSF